MFSSFGEYDLCLEIKSQSTDETKSDETIYGKYCLVKPVLAINDFSDFDDLKDISVLNQKSNEWIKRQIKTNINKLKLVIASNHMTDKLYPFSFGICIPSQCQPKDVDAFLREGQFQNNCSLITLFICLFVFSDSLNNND